MNEIPEVKVKPIACLKQLVKVEVDSNDSLLECLNSQKSKLGTSVWSLAFAGDGVVWGKMVSGELKFSAPLNSIGLQTLYLFGDLGEFRLWREGRDFRGCLLTDKEDKSAEAYDISYMLWGTQVDQPGEIFSLVSDGQQGLKHAVPLPLKANESLNGHPLRISIRNYLSEDKDGQVYIGCSRLLRVFKLNQEVKK